MATAINRIHRVLTERHRYWFPKVVDQAATEKQLEEFYRSRSDYHAMTASSDKAVHCQVKLLLSLIEDQQTCIDFGCGGGLVLELVSGRCSRAIGIDISESALAMAASRPNMRAELIRGDVKCTGLPSGIADVAFSLEVMEHIWDPGLVIIEMLRVLKPGGILFITTPNGYGLNMHLSLRLHVRFLDTVYAASVWLREAMSKRAFRNMQPDLDARPVYADCDMITKVFPRKLRTFVSMYGGYVERLETHWFMASYAPNDSDAKRFRKLERHRFYRHFGDHILLVARKR
jgi:2-polyprenyl-3-methyl-5-hydroxy-6-metoxy-1,4-benzoquinol methylase